jgi:tol-pal system protein YbgF
VQQQGLAALQQAPAAQIAALPAATPEAQYEFAYGLLIRRDIPSVEVALAEFVSKHPDHPLAGNALYWLGETFYVRQDFMAAARTFAEGYSSYPKSSKAPDNLLKLAMSLNALGRKDDACITFTKLIDEYPRATASVRRRAERERGLLACS